MSNDYQKTSESTEKTAAHNELISAIALWGLANNRDWNPEELEQVTQSVERFLSKREET